MLKIRRNRTRHAFTLVEMLIVVTLLGIVAALMTRAFSNAREIALGTKCQSNLRQMVQAAILYEAEHGEFPPSYSRNFNTRQTRTWESFLWEMGPQFQIHQCPAFRGDANWEEDRYAGYNYNSSYIGGRIFVRNGQRLPSSKRSASLADIYNPVHCALFGDGEYANGANKFMRSPFPGRLDSDASLALGGTQGFRHRARTNVGFADGSVRSLQERHTGTSASGSPAQGCGFLSSDNRLYDFE